VKILTWNIWNGGVGRIGAIAGCLRRQDADVVALQEANARNTLTDHALKVKVKHESNPDVEQGFVFDQNPNASTGVEKGSLVVIDVSTGKPQVTIPNVVGQNQTDAVEELTRANLDARVVEVSSNQKSGTVIGQFPKSGVVVVAGTQVRINVSSGPKQIAVPAVISLPYEQAASELQQRGFKVSRTDVDSDQAEGIVTDQDPKGGSAAAQGSTVKLSVSKGPKTVSVPDVTTQEYSVAVATLEGAGFKVRKVLEDTDDPSLEGIVISQDPGPGSQAKPKSVVTLFVGRLAQSTQTTTTTETTTP
jgi:serine/threonine-protein kinase